MLWVVADRAGHVPARAELELLRPVRVLGPAQGRAAQQRQPLRFFWLQLLGQTPERGGNYGWFVRELPGIVLVLAYLLLLPPLLAKTVLRRFFIKMGFVRFIMLVTLIQFMASLPIKMVLRWTFNLKYIVFIPEYFFNI